MGIYIPVENIEQHVAVLAKIGNLGDKFKDGFLRASWSDEESSAMETIKEAALLKGMQAEYDKVGNLFLSTPGSAKEVVQAGSHIDTVPNGGMYDGGAGILCALEAVLALREDWSRLNAGLKWSSGAGKNQPPSTQCVKEAWPLLE